MLALACRVTVVIVGLSLGSLLAACSPDPTPTPVSPSLGAEDAPVTVLEFVDFQ